MPVQSGCEWLVMVGCVFYTSQRILCCAWGAATVGLLGRAVVQCVHSVCGKHGVCALILWGHLEIKEISYYD